MRILTAILLAYLVCMLTSCVDQELESQANMSIPKPSLRKFRAKQLFFGKEGPKLSSSYEIIAVDTLYHLGDTIVQKLNNSSEPVYYILISDVAE